MQDTPERETLNAMRSLLVLACKTIAAMRDPDLRFLRHAAMPWHFVRDVQEAYGYQAAKARFVPSARDISMLDITGDWLAWLRREEGNVAISRFFHFAAGISAAELGRREECSRQTILNRIDRSCAAVLVFFGEQSILIDAIEEPPERDPPYFRLDRATKSDAGIRGLMGKTWVTRTKSGDGRFMRNGREVRDGSEKLERLKVPA